MFRFVNSQADEIEQLEISINELRDELKKYQAQGKSVNIDEKKRKELKDLEERLSKTELKAEQFELEFQQSLKKVNNLKP